MLVDEIRKIQKETQPERDSIIKEKTTQLFREIKAELIQAAKNPAKYINTLTVKAGRYPPQCYNDVVKILREEGFMVTFSGCSSYINISW